MIVDWTNLPVDVGVAEVICCLLSKVDTATPNQSEPIINLELDDFKFNASNFWWDPYDDK